jgi:O-antigen ligase
VTLVAADPAGWQPFGPAKWSALTITLLVAGVVVRPRRWERSTSIAWVAFLAWTAITCVGALDPLYAWTGTPERRFGLATWVLCATAFAIGQSCDREALRAGALWAGVGVGVWSTVEAIRQAPLIALDTDTSRLTGPFGSAAYLGACCALLLPIALGSVTRRRPLAIVAIALLTVALVGSGSRAAWVGTLVALAAMAVVRRGRVALLGVAVLVALIALSPMRDRIDAGASRVDEWRIAARVIADRPVLGTGPEGYRIAFVDHVDQRYLDRYGTDVVTDRAHSIVLDIAATVGLPGLALFVVLMALVMRHVVTAMRGGEWVAVGLVAYVVQQLLLFPVMELDPLWWLLAGSLVVARNELRIPRVLPLVAVPVLVLAVLGAVLDISADRLARRSVEALGESRAVRATQLAEQAVELRPDVVRLHLLAARAALAQGPPGRAVARAHLDDAARISPDDPFIARERARLG